METSGQMQSHEARRIPPCAPLPLPVRIRIFPILACGDRETVLRCFRPFLRFGSGESPPFGTGRGSNGGRHVAPRGSGLSKLSIMGFHAKHL